MKHKLAILLIPVLLLTGVLPGAQANAAPASSGPAAPAAAGTPFLSAAFQKVWERTDKLVADQSVGRSWFWGPQANTATVEFYRDAPGGQRLVQYFDKSRMEINNPAGDPNSPFFVTNGLLVVEMISGQMQVGDNTYEPRDPANVNVSGDFDDPNAPTYRSFQNVANTSLGDHKSPDKTGQKATADDQPRRHGRQRPGQSQRPERGLCPLRGGRGPQHPQGVLGLPEPERPDLGERANAQRPR